MVQRASEDTVQVRLAVASTAACIAVSLMLVPVTAHDGLLALTHQGGPQKRPDELHVAAE